MESFHAPRHLPLPWVMKFLIGIVLLVHVGFFTLEAICWMQPSVYTALVALLDNPVDTPASVQALTLRNLFINQGFYNLMLVVGGTSGLILIWRGHAKAGYPLLFYVCIAATVAGIVLALTTKALGLALLQAVPAVFACAGLLPRLRHSMGLPLAD